MYLYLGGAEIPGWRTLLKEQGVEHVAMSYMGLRRRQKFTKPWLIADKFPENQKVFLDSGAYTVNKADADAYTQRDLKDIAAHYMTFVQDNIDRVEMVSEFDALPLGMEWIRAMREDFWDDIPEDKFLPIWHGGDLGVLDDLAQKYKRVGIVQTALGERNLAPTLNGLVQKYGTLLHGVAMTKPQEMADIRWDSVASTSWLSPSQYGDTIVWTGKELKRYPKKYKDQARRQHRTLFTDKGFDAAAIEADDSKEILRLSIWSWRQQVEDLSRHGGGVTTPPDSPESVNTETGEVGVGTPSSDSRKAVATRVERETVPLPVMGLGKTSEHYVNDEGERAVRDLPLVEIRSASQRICNTCFLKDKCPAFMPDANCAYNIPLELKTKEQYRALQDGLIEMQGARVLFMKMAEDMEGGYADPNLSNEIDRLQKLIAQKHEMEQESFSLNIQAKGTPGQAGMISRLFGRDAGDTAQALPAPIPADRVIESNDVFEAELVDLPISHGE